jgi:hypothetical protein
MYPLSGSKGNSQFQHQRKLSEGNGNRKTYDQAL